MDTKSYPLILSREIEKLLRTFRSLLNQHSHIIESHDSKHLVSLRDKDKPDFYFRVYGPGQNKEGLPIFHLQYVPENEIDFLSANRNISLEKIIGHFHNWISIIENFNAINYTEDDNNMQFYEKEFYSEF